MQKVCLSTRSQYTITVEYANTTAQTPYMFPVVGGRKVEHLKANVAALSLELTPEDVSEIDRGYDFDLGFPHNFLNMAGFMSEGPQHVTTLNSMGHFDYVAASKAIKPHQGQPNAACKDLSLSQ